MGRPSSTFVTLASAALLVIAMARPECRPVTIGGPVREHGASPAAPGAAPSGAPAATAVGPIVWKRVTKGKDFTRNAAVYGVEQLPDGRLMVVGSVADASGLPTGAAWTSRDGVKWSRLKIKAPKGSFVYGGRAPGRVAHRGGARRDGTGLLWTSADGSAWTSADPPSGVVYDLTATDGGLVGTGVDDGAATVWLTADGATWQSHTLAPSRPSAPRRAGC